MKSQLSNFLVVVALICAAAAAGAEDEIPSTTSLTRAIRVENFTVAKANITRELVNQSDLGGYHPLTYATYTRNQELVKALLNGAISFSPFYPTGASPCPPSGAFPRVNYKNY